MGRVLRIINGVARSVDESGSVTIYDEVYSVVSTISTGTPLTLPASQTYTEDELEVYFDTERLIPVQDYNYVGSPLRTQVSFTFDLLVGDKIRFRIDRSA